MKRANDEQPAIRRATVVFALLVALTVVTWAIGRLGLSGLPVSLAVLVVALFKGHLIGDWFMGLRRCSGIWRWVIVIWLLVPGALITTAFVMSAGG